MEIIVIIQAAIIILLIKTLLSKDKKVKEATSLLNGYGNERESITYSWKLDSARKTKLKGHLTLRFNPDEIKEQRLNNPFATFNNSNTNGVESNLRKMYFYMHV